MTKLQLFLYKMHELFEMHNFKLVPVSGGFKARCACGVFVGRPKK